MARNGSKADFVPAFYDFHLIAQTGQNDLTNISAGASINDAGVVAFVASKSEGQSVYVGSGAAPPTIVSFPAPSSTRTYGAEVQINNNDLVSAVDVIGGGRLARVWNADIPGTNTILARASIPPLTSSYFDSLGNFTSLSNDDKIAFAGLQSDQNQWEIHLSDSLVDARDTLNGPTEVTTLTTSTFFRQMAAEGDFVVVGARIGAQADSPKTITLYNISQGQLSASIASTTSGLWSNLGVRPGISDDGKIVTFYGDLTAAGATSITQTNGDAVPLPVRPGPGIFASVLLGAAPFQHRVIIRVSGETGNGEIDPGERLPIGSNVEVGPDFDFDGTAEWGLSWNSTLVDSRPGVTSFQAFNDVSRGSYVQVVYAALDPVHGGVKGLYSSRLNLFKDAAGNYFEAGVEAPVQVVRVGETEQGLTLTDLSVNDPVNNNGVIAFWAAAGSTQAVITATPDFSDQVNSRPRFDPDSPLVEYVVAGFPGNAARQPINQIVLHATGGREKGSLLTLTAGSTPGIHYLISREGRVTQIIPESKTANHAPPSNPNSIGIEMVDDYTGATGTGHIENANWSTTIQQSKAALLVRDIGQRRGIDLTHLTTSDAPGPFETSVDEEAGQTPNRNGIGRDTSGILAHGQVLNRTAGRTDPQNFPSGALSPGTSYTWGAFMTRVNNGIGLQLNSPANLLVIDPQGRRVGVDPDTGEVFNEIPGAKFSGPGTEPETLSIPNGIAGSYTILVVGTATGSYHLDVFAAGDDGGLTSTRIAGLTSLGEISTYTLDYSDQEGDGSRLTGTGNLPPAAFDDFAYTDEATPIDVRVAENDSDPDGSLDSSSILVTMGPANGNLGFDGSTGVFTYVPNAGFYGTDVFKYAIRDDQGSLSNEAVVTIFVVKHTLTPIAVYDETITSQDTPTTINVLSNDFDDDGLIDSTSVEIAHEGDPEHGEVSVDIVTGQITYIPDIGYIGVDSFKYTVRDNDGAISNEATVTVTVLSEGNIPPTAGDDPGRTTLQNTPLVIDVLANDSDPDGTLDLTSVAIVTGPAHGSLSVNPTTGVVTYTPNAGYVGLDSFEYTVKDDQGATSNAALVSIEVTAPPNQPPSAGDDPNQTTLRDTPLVIDVLANDGDPDGSLDPTTVAIVSGPSHGILSVDPTTGVVTYTPTTGYVGPDSFSYTVKDDQGALSNVALVSIVVNAPANVPPVAGDDPNRSTPRDTPLVIDVLANDSDPDGTLDPATVTIVTGPSHGALSVDATAGAVTYTPTSGYVGSDSFTYTVKDDQGALSNVATVSIQVTAPANVPPVAGDDPNQSTLRDTPLVIDVLANDGDPDGSLDLTSVAIVTAPTHGLVTVDAATGAVTYTPNVGFVGSDSFTYTVKDDQGAVSNVALVSIDVTAPPNQSPTAADDPNGKTLQDTPLVVNVLTNDSDADGSIDPTTVTIVSGPAHGTASVDPVTGLVTYTPAAGFVGSDSFTYTVKDDQGAVSNVATASIDVQLPLKVLGVVVNGGATQRSNVESIAIQFNQATNLADLIANGTIGDVVGVYAVTNAPGKVGLSASHYSWNAATNTLTIDLTVDGFGGSQTTMLGDDNYQLRLGVLGVLAAGSNVPLTDSDGTDDGVYVSAFHRLAGDFNGDKVVNTQDQGYWTPTWATTAVSSSRPTSRRSGRRRASSPRWATCDWA